MPMHRKNKGGEGTRGRNDYAAWFWPSVRRSRRRRDLAKISRRRNR
jgi:hypothetical protein